LLYGLQALAACTSAIPPHIAVPSRAPGVIASSSTAAHL